MTKPRPIADPEVDRRIVGHNSHAEWLPVSDLIADQTYQRDIRERKVAKMVEEFDPERLGTIEVALRPNGSYRVIDGQHRLETLRRLGMSDRLVLCNVRVRTSTAEEAHLFWKMNQDRTALSSWDLWRARLAAEDPPACDLAAKLEALKIPVVAPSSAAYAGGMGSLVAIGTAMTLHEREWSYDRATPLLVRTFRVLRDAWTEQANPYDQTLIRGMTLFLAQHEHYVEEDRLVAALRKVIPQQILHDARALKKASQWALASFVALTIEGAYNFNRAARSKLRDTPVSAYAQALREYERRHRGGDDEELDDEAAPAAEEA